MAFVALHPSDLEAFRARPRRQRACALGLRAAAPHSDGHLDQHTDVEAFEGIDGLVGVDGHRNPRSRRGARQLSQLRPSHHLIGDEDVVEPRVGQHDGFVRDLRGEPGGAEIALPPRDLDALVGLEVRPHARRPVGEERRHRAQVLLQHVLIDEKRRRHQFLDPHVRGAYGGGLGAEHEGGAVSDGKL